MKIKGNKGLTLLEIVISLAIIGILAVLTLSVFSAGFLGIVKAGNKNIANFSVQKDVERELNDNTDPTGSTLTITLPDSTSETINGAIVHMEDTVNGSTGSIYFFKPFD